MKQALKKHLKQAIIVDTRSSWIYIGRLEEVGEGFIVLSDVDVHDSVESPRPKEVYVMESKISGVKANRQCVYVNLDYLVSFSPLDDVKEFREFFHSSVPAPKKKRRD